LLEPQTNATVEVAFVRPGIPVEGMIFPIASKIATIAGESGTPPDERD
jgi:hypothetical protein